MPVQQAIDVAVPIETAYNQWTQFEDWPEFMHRVTRVTQDDDNKVTFTTKIWGMTREFEAEIVTQRPDERIKWKVTQGMTHTGVVTFHELAPNLTRIEVNLDVEPGSLIEKAGRGMRHVKRAVRADLHRFKAFIEMQEDRDRGGAARSRTARSTRSTTGQPTRSASTPRSTTLRRSRSRRRRQGVDGSRSRVRATTTKPGPRRGARTSSAANVSSRSRSRRARGV